MESLINYEAYFQFLIYLFSKRASAEGVLKQPIGEMKRYKTDVLASQETEQGRMITEVEDYIFFNSKKTKVLVLRDIRIEGQKN